MQLFGVLWKSLSIIGAVVAQGNERDNNTRTSTDSRSGDYDPNYADYVDRDYPSLDYYYEDREGRSLHDDHNTSPNDDADSRHREQEAEEFMLKQLKSTIPGTPGIDYALYQSVPDTSFRCDTQTSPGFYGDVEAQCQVFHICQDDDRQDSFLCPVGTVFNQISFICDWWFNFNCDDTPTYYHLNDKFHSSNGLTTMKDTMKRMKKFQDNKDMHMIMNIAKFQKNFLPNMQSRRNRASDKHSMLPKVRNLFMLRMRKNKLEHIRNAVAPNNNLEVTPETLSTDRTPLALKATRSTGYLDVSLLEYTTTTSNTTLVNLNNMLSNPERINLTNTFNISNGASSLEDTPLKSLLNLPNIEMVINGSIATTMELDSTDGDHTETSPFTEAGYLNRTRDILKNISDGNVINVHTESHSDMQLETEYPFNTSTAVPRNDIYLENKTNSLDLVQNTEPTTISSKQPFNHENNFIIGNDTHISVSVTIHTKSGHSKLQWKRLPGIKRIRRVRFKSADENLTFQRNPANETIYKKRNDVERPRSRVMWIPAKKNNLDREIDWKTSLESRPYVTIATMNMKNYIESLAELKKEAFESTQISLSNIENISHVENNKTEENSSKISLYTPTTHISTQESHTTPIMDVIETEMLKTIVENPEQFNKTETISDTITAIQTNMNNQTTPETPENCTKICIKLLRSLYINYSEGFTESTNSGKAPSALTLFDYETSESKNNHDYGRKSVLGISPTEEWTVKYGPGPNCSENTDNDKVLIKGWSVIIDTGSVTKEKTVKKRGCSHNSNDNKILVMGQFVPYKNSYDGGITFNATSSNIPLNSKEKFGGSNDQRYWLNLVKKWLEHSSNENNDKTRSIQKQKPSSNGQWMFDKFPNLENDKRYGNAEENSFAKQQNKFNSKAKSSHNAHRPRDRNLNYKNRKLNLETGNTNYGRDSVGATQFSKDSTRQRQWNFQSSKPDWSSDLQTERSDWFQDTHATTDRFNNDRNKRDSNRGYAPDWNPDRTHNDKIPQTDNGKRSTQISDENQNDWLAEIRDTKRDFNSQNDEDSSEYSSDEDFGDWFTRNSNQNWKGSSRDEDRPTAKSDWPADTWQQGKGDSLFPGDKHMRDSRGDSRDWSSNNSKGTRTSNKGAQSDTRAKGWSFERRDQRKRPGRDDSGAWEPDSDTRNNKGKPSNRPSNPRRDANRSVKDEWNWSSEKGYDDSIPPLRNDYRNNWNSMKPHGTDSSTDKKIPREDTDWISRRQEKPKPRRSSSRFKDDNVRTSMEKGQGKTWFTNEQMKGSRIFDSKIKGGGIKDEPWKKSVADGQDDFKSKNGWQSEGNDWSSEKQGEYRPPNSDWDQDSSYKGPVMDEWNSKSNGKSNWSSSSRGGRNKGFAVHSQESPIWPSQNNRGWALDEETDRWPSKSTNMDNRPSNHPLRHKNTKGDPHPGFNQDRTPTSWSSNDQDDWEDDDETWMFGSSRNRALQKGARMEPDLSSESDSWARRTPMKGIREDRRPTKPNAWSKGSTPSKGSNTGSWGSKNLPDSKSVSSNRDSQKSKTKNDGNSWGSSNKGSINTPQPSSSKGSDWSKSKMVGKRNGNPKNTSNKGDSEMKKIIWSVQISSDGKLGNGWVPITLRPTVRNRLNETGSDWNNKGSSLKGEDWKNNRGSSNDWDSNNKGTSFMEKGSLKGEDWNNGDSSEDWDWNKNSNKGSSFKDEDWKNTDDTTKDRDWNKGTSFMEEKSSRYGDWNNTSNKGSLSTDEKWDEKRSVRDNKGFSDADWDSRDTKNTKLKIEISEHSQTTSEQKDDTETVTNLPSTHLPEASFRHLFFIPDYNVRYKREYENRGRRRLQTRDTTNRSYKMIKSGEILNDHTEDNSKFFLARAGITVEDRRNYKNLANTNFDLKKHFDHEATETTPTTIKFDIHNSEINSNTKKYHMHATNWDKLPKESNIKESWSSPLLSSNFSISGWIPVTTLQPRKVFNVTKLDSATSDNVYKLKTPLNGIHNVSLSENDNAKIFDHLIVKNISGESNSYSASKTFDILKHHGDVRHKTENYTNTEKPSKAPEIVTEMKVGNKTLKILSFSDVMKQLQKEDDLFQDLHNVDTWNVPITINPKTYSLKLINPLKESTNNKSNSWTFPSNENGTKQAWVLVENNNSRHSPSKNAHMSEFKPSTVHNKTVDVYKIIIGNRTKISDRDDRLVNSTSLTLPHSKNDTSYFKFTNWDANSNWTPVIRTVGRVVSYNRTLMLDKESPV